MQIYCRLHLNFGDKNVPLFSLFWHVYILWVCLSGSSALDHPHNHNSFILKHKLFKPEPSLGGLEISFFLICMQISHQGSGSNQIMSCG